MDFTALEAVFRAAIYRVDTPEGRFDLRIGRPNSVFDEYLRAEGVSHWGVITACNPGAMQLSDEMNQLLQAKLRGSLESAGWRFFEASNLDAKGVWPVESSCLVLQIDQKCLCALAAHFAQLAVVWGETGSPPRLLWVSQGLGDRCDIVRTGG